MELRAYLSYNRKREPLTFWRSTSGYEVDFIVGDEIAIEVKSATRVTDKMLSGLKALSEEGRIKKFFLISQDRINSRKNGIHILHWEEFLNRLWAGDVVV
jgi:predicted AAA+ superfamily ATPase